MRYLSVCSGIEAATVAWHPLGWQAAAFSEIEPFPRAVLGHHYPHTPLHGDFTTIGADEYGPIDLLVGGTPCQSFSIAGLRGGLADERGNLALEFLRLADRTRPRWLVWENVPGVLSSEGGRDFGTFLGGLGQLGYGFAYRVLDAQHFGVPQRRRRVFVVGYLGDWRRAAAVLFERHSLQGNPAPRRNTGQGSTGRTARSVAIRGRDGTPQAELGDEVANAILTPNGGRGGVGVGAALIGGWDYENNAHGADDPTGPLLKGSPTGGGRPLPAVAFGWQNSASHGDSVSEHITPSLDKSKTPAVAFPIMPMNSGKDYVARPTDVAQPIMAGGPVGGNQGGDFVRQASAVRRLTPRECARLQGFPDDYLDIIYRGKPAADGPKYKALGNSMAVPVMAWIGQRIALVDALQTEMGAAA
jgi:DNA (cytosine-5)-methyltransferase 1